MVNRFDLSDDLFKSLYEFNEDGSIKFDGDRDEVIKSILEGLRNQGERDGDRALPVSNGIYYAELDLTDTEGIFTYFGELRRPRTLDPSRIKTTDSLTFFGRAMFSFARMRNVTEEDDFLKVKTYYKVLFRKIIIIVRQEVSEKEINISNLSIELGRRMGISEERIRKALVRARRYGNKEEWSGQ